MKKRLIGGDGGLISAKDNGVQLEKIIVLMATHGTIFLTNMRDHEFIVGVRMDWEGLVIIINAYVLH